MGRFEERMGTGRQRQGVKLKKQYFDEKKRK